MEKQQGHKLVMCEWSRRVGVIGESPLLDQALKVRTARTLHFEGSFEDGIYKITLAMVGVIGDCGCSRHEVHSMVRRGEKIGVLRC